MSDESLLGRIQELEAENARLRAEVEEWLCVKCRIVYPAKPHPAGPEKPPPWWHRQN